MTQLSAPTSSTPAISNPLDYAPAKSGFRLPKWLMPLAVVGGVVFLLGSILLPSLCAPRETANRVKCAANLKQIGNALMLFAQEHDGKYPDQLSELVATEDLTPNVFVCPSGTAESSTASTPAEIATDLAKPEHNSFIYLKQNLGKADQAIVCESLKDHDEDGMNILYGDFHVEFISHRPTDLKAFTEAGIPSEFLGTKTQ